MRDAARQLAVRLRRERQPYGPANDRICRRRLQMSGPGDNRGLYLGTNSIGRLTACRRAEPADELERAWRGVLPCICSLDRDEQRLTPNADRAHRHLPRPDLDGAEGILEKRAIPSARLPRPRAHEHTAVENHHPDADEPMVGSLPRAHAENLARVDDGNDRARQSPSPAQFFPSATLLVWAICSPRRLHRVSRKA